MLLDQMSFQVVTQAEGLRADVAGVTFRARMDELVPVQVRLARELRVADGAGIGGGCAAGGPATRAACRASHGHSEGRGHDHDRRGGRHDRRRGPGR